MNEVILNDECMHCNDKECHDGEHFCNQAMKDNSFYKNAKLYKGLEVIQRPTYEDLEKENAKLKTDYKILSCSVGDFGELQKKLEEEQRKNNGLSDNLTKAKEIIKKLKVLYLSPVVTKDDVKRQDEILVEVEQFLSEVQK